MKNTGTEGELAEPIFIRNILGMKLLACGASKYFELARTGKIIIVGRGRMSRTYYPSIRKYAEQLLSEAGLREPV
jgi:hypothetical protein